MSKADSIHDLAIPNSQNSVGGNLQCARLLWGRSLPECLRAKKRKPKALENFKTRPPTDVPRVEKRFDLFVCALLGATLDSRHLCTLPYHFTVVGCSRPVWRWGLVVICVAWRGSSTPCLPVSAYWTLTPFYSRIRRLHFRRRRYDTYESTSGTLVHSVARCRFFILRWNFVSSILLRLSVELYKFRRTDMIWDYLHTSLLYDPHQLSPLLYLIWIWSSSPISFTTNCSLCCYWLVWLRRTCCLCSLSGKYFLIFPKSLNCWAPL
jgi:hypothetical protein